MVVGMDCDVVVIVIVVGEWVQFDIGCVGVKVERVVFGCVVIIIDGLCKDIVGIEVFCGDIIDMGDVDIIVIVG